MAVGIGPSQKAFWLGSLSVLAALLALFCCCRCLLRRLVALVTALFTRPRYRYSRTLQSSTGLDAEDDEDDEDDMSWASQRPTWRHQGSNGPTNGGDAAQPGGDDSDEDAHEAGVSYRIVFPDEKPAAAAPVAAAGGSAVDALTRAARAAGAHVALPPPPPPVPSSRQPTPSDKIISL